MEESYRNDWLVFIGDEIVKRTVKKKKVTLFHRIEPLLYLAPAFLVLGVFVYYPFFKTIGESFFLLNSMGQIREFIGIENYVNVLTKAADASYQREAILANNISNVDTPGYKRKDLNFEGVLSQELGRCKHQSLDKKISELDTSKLTANVYTDHSNYSYRMDGNNVDIDTENVELASEQIKYEALTSSISSQFSRMKSVL